MSNDQTTVLSPLDRDAIRTARTLAMDAVENAGSGHPGTAMALAPLAHLLFQRHLRHDPSTPDWDGRDLFVLSCGHASILQYIQMYLTGYDSVTLDDLRTFRRLDSRTPGHPEYGHTAGIETTTGPLGQGIATAVGMAMELTRQKALHDPRPDGTSPFDRTVWVVCSDGDLQEGISYEAAALAGHHRLSNLVVVYDDNRIQIEGSTDLADTEDVAARFAAQGWNVRTVDLAGDGDIDVDGLDRALSGARAEADAPTLVILRSVIAWPAPAAQNQASAHGSPLGAAEVAATKAVLGVATDTSFEVSAEVLEHTRGALARGAELRKEWERTSAAWREREPELARAWASAGSPVRAEALDLPAFEPGAKVATRDASGQTIQLLAERLPEMWGGSADLGDSNKTTIKGAASFLPASPGGRVVHWGVREHAMAAAANGMALVGRSRPFVGTFFVFSDYQRPAIRLASLMGLPVTYVWTHDSVALGADGPTHQPIEHLASLRAMPGLAVVRPADAKETAAAWAIAVEPRSFPIGLVLARQGVEVLDVPEAAVLAGVRAGAYAVRDQPNPTVVLVASGSEVTVALDAADELVHQGERVRVVSMPCREWFMARPEAERLALIPDGVPTVVVEAASSFGWADVVGRGARMVTIDRFGASGSAEDVMRALGICAEAVVAAAREVRPRVS